MTPTLKKAHLHTKSVSSIHSRRSLREKSSSIANTKAIYSPAGSQQRAGMSPKGQVQSL